ncbi:CLUMA_CG019533, isoform A [Clunio marinus]|uniref:CLUMA_CG019533, isoform A n=1 Tax=Clunio marinus TaxID=568069 RepID=A0A1J1J2F0_9DIPT|nr:CLUMA_CG019533, isoform A [Clunio marinus]
MTKEIAYISYGPDYGELLPTEILIKIFEFLHPSDRFNASQICKRFQEVSEHYKFINDSQLNFSKITFSRHEAPAKDFLHSFRSFPNISFTDVEFSDCEEFWQRHGEAVETLTINSCDITVRKLKMILKETPNLHYLEIQNSRELFMSGRLFEENDLLLENVTSLSLPNNQYLSDCLFSRITRIMPNLAALDLSSNKISFHGGLYKKFYPNHDNGDDIGSDNVFTFHFIKKFIKNRADKIKELNFNSTLIDGNTLQLLSEIDELNLSKLHLRQCDQLTNDGFTSLIRVQPQLTSLDLTFSVRITDSSVIAISETLKDLRLLKLRRCRSLTDLSIKMLADLQFLEVLDISECEALTSAAITDGIAFKSNVVLKELYLAALNIDENAITKITENIPNLRVLDLSFCFNHVDDVCVQMIFKNLLFLRELNLDSCERISDEGLTGMSMKEKLEDFCKKEEQQEKVNEEMKQEPIVSGTINNLPEPAQRTIFKISLRTKAEDEIVSDALRKKAMMQMAMEINTNEEESSNFSIKKLKGLRVLKLGSCNKISDVSLIYNFKLPELREINLSKCQQISYDGVKALVENCPGLEVVNFSECHNISDKCIELVATKLQRLTSLDISRCFKLTDYSLDYIALNCKRIRELNVHGCRQMSDEPHLRLINAVSLKNISFAKPGSNVDSRAPIPPSFRLASNSRNSFPLPLPFRY